jgi:uncharacterized membrane protein
MKVFGYCLKIWLISVVTGTLLYYFVGNPTDDSSMTFWGYMGVVCLAATVYSLVSFLLFWIGVYVLAGRPYSARQQKSIGSAWATILAIAPFPILFGRNHPNWALLAELSGCYLVPVVAGIWVFRFPRVAAGSLS